MHWTRIGRDFPGDSTPAALSLQFFPCGETQYSSPNSHFVPSTSSPKTWVRVIFRLAETIGSGTPWPRESRTLVESKRVLIESGSTARPSIPLTQVGADAINKRARKEPKTVNPKEFPIC